MKTTNGGFKFDHEASRSDPCPICGHTHACKFLEKDEDGESAIMCLWVHDEGNKLGYDNKRYVFFMHTKNNMGLDSGWTVYKPYKEYRAGYAKLTPAETEQVKLRRREAYRALPSESREFLKHLFDNRQLQKSVVRTLREDPALRETYEKKYPGAADYLLKDFSEKSAEEFKKAEAFEKLGDKEGEEELKPLDNETMDKYNRFLLSRLILEPYHREYLKSQGWNDELIHNQHVKSFPLPDYIRAKYPGRLSGKNILRRELAESIEARYGKGCLKGFPGAYLDRQDRRTLNGPSGIIYPMYDKDGYMYRLRIRMDWLDIDRDITFSGGEGFFAADGDKYAVNMKGIFRCDGTGRTRMDDDLSGRRGKYRTLASLPSQKEGCRSANVSGLYHTIGDNIKICFITEGEPKAIFSNYKLKMPVISVPGVNSYSIIFADGVIKKMVELGCELFVAAYDADKVNNQGVLEFETRLCEALLQEGLNVAIATWDINDGKGLDDLLAAGKTPGFQFVRKEEK